MNPEPTVRRARGAAGLLGAAAPLAMFAALTTTPLVAAAEPASTPAASDSACLTSVPVAALTVKWPDCGGD